MKDEHVIAILTDRAIELARTLKPTHLLEIGPGRGALTLPLLDWRATQALPPLFTVCEFDRALAAEWRNSGHPMTVIDQDFLKVPETQWLPAGARLGVVSNLPYASGTAILTRIAGHPRSVPFMVLMFQKEVAQRLRADPGTKAWGSLSLWIQNRWDVSKVCEVSKHAFLPPPKVESEAVELRPKTEPRLKLTEQHPREWEGLLRLAFAHRRKMLRSAIPRKSPAQIALDASGLDGTKRAEALRWDEWGQWLEALIRVLDGTLKGIRA